MGAKKFKEKGEMYLKNYQNLSELPLALSAKDVMMALGLSRTGVYNLFKQADFPTIKVGSRIIVPKDRFIQWMDREVGDHHDAV